MATLRKESASETEARQRMVDEQLVRRGVADPRVLEAMRSVPRHAFVSPDLRRAAYEDGALPIGHGQTISQPFVVAFMAEQARVRATDRALEIGAGCGYASAVLSRLAKTVDAVERLPELVAASAGRLASLGYDNVRVHQAGDSLGLPAEASFDVILVSAAAGSMPSELLNQLADGGRMIIPVGPSDYGQKMMRVTRQREKFRCEKLGRFAFVPLVQQRD